MIVDRWAGGNDGPAVYVRDLSRGLLARGHAVALLYAERRGTASVSGLEEIQLDGLSRSRPVDGAEKELLRVHDRFRPDTHLLECLDVPWFVRVLAERGPVMWTLHTHTLTCPNWSRVWWSTGHLCDRDFGPLCAYHHFVSGCGRGGGMRTLVRNLRRCREARASLDYCDAIHALNGYMAETFRRAGVPEDKLFVAPSPAPFFDEGAVWVEREPEPGRILFVGRLDREKGVEYLLRACQRLDEEFRVRVVGDVEVDAFSKGMQALVVELGLTERCQFVGPLGRTALSEEYGRASCVVVPSIWGDPSPLVRLEAMAHGRPVIVFESGGTASVVEPGITGEVVPRGDVVALANALGRLLRDPSRARRMGRAGRTRVETLHTCIGHATEVVGMLDRLLARRRFGRERTEGA